MALRLLFIISLLAAATSLAFVAWQVAMPQRVRAPVVGDVLPSPAAPTVQKVRVIAAVRALNAGALLREEDLAVREYLPDEMPESGLVQSEETRAELRGALLRAYVERNDPITRASVLRPRERGFLAAVLRPGMRAVTIGVDAVTGTAGLIWPGDQVDVLLTQSTDVADAPVGRRVWSETVLPDIRIIAVDQELTQGASAPAATRTARTVTLEVTPDQAERVAVASQLGRLSLSVRSIENPPPTEEPVVERAPTVFGADVSPALARQAVGPQQRMRVIQGEAEQEVRFR